jgi:hypothetical protein
LPTCRPFPRRDAIPILPWRQVANLPANSTASWKLAATSLAALIHRSAETCRRKVERILP